MSATALAEAPVIVVPSATGVEAQLVLAGPGARALAFVLDWLIRCKANLVVFASLIAYNIDPSSLARARFNLVQDHTSANLLKMLR